MSLEFGNMHAVARTRQRGRCRVVHNISCREFFADKLSPKSDIFNISVIRFLYLIYERILSGDRLAPHSPAQTKRAVHRPELHEGRDGQIRTATMLYGPAVVDRRYSKRTAALA